MDDGQGDYGVEATFDDVEVRASSPGIEVPRINDQYDMQALDGLAERPPPPTPRPGPPPRRLTLTQGAHAHTETHALQPTVAKALVPRRATVVSPVVPWSAEWVSACARR